MHNKLVFGSAALSAVVFIGGCFGHASGYAEADAPVVFAAEPTLVVVEPGIWVVRDYDYPVYYVDDYYWVYRDDVWYRSPTYDGGWARAEVSVVPTRIVNRDHRVYVHYHGAPNAPTRSAPRVRGSDRDRPARADEHRDLQPDRNQDKGPRGPERADDRHEAPPERRPEDDPARDRHEAPPQRDDHPDADRHGDPPGRRDNDKREDHEKAGGKPDEQRKQDNHEQKRGDKRDDHDKR